MCMHLDPRGIDSASQACTRRLGPTAASRDPQQGVPGLLARCEWRDWLGICLFILHDCIIVISQRAFQDAEHVFLLSYRVFMNSRALVERLRPYTQKSNNALGGVLILLQEWTFSFWYDFSDDSELIPMVQALATAPDPESDDSDTLVDARATLRRDILETSLLQRCFTQYAFTYITFTFSGHSSDNLRGVTTKTTTSVRFVDTVLVVVT